MAAVNNESVVEEEQQSMEDINLLNLPYEEKIKFASPIATPMASCKATKKCLKLLKKARQNKTCYLSVKDACKQIIKKNKKGIVLLAGDAYPIDLISHMPIVCEEYSIPYIYIPTGVDLGSTKQGVSTSLIAFVNRDEEYGELYDKCLAMVEKNAEEE